MTTQTTEQLQLACNATHMGWWCCLTAHPERPDAHYMIHPEQLRLW